MPEPLVSCIMPTRDRRPFVPLAIECFLAQEHRERELVIVDDGEDPVGDLVPRDPRIRYERLDGTTVLGAKRNLACGLARGGLIAHWDDDDWSAPRRLAVQVASLEDSRLQLSGLAELLFFDPVAEQAWHFVYPQSASRPWVAGGTLCYRRSFWEAHPFPEIRVGEDSRFVWAPQARIAALDDIGIYAATVHGGNTSRKRPRPPRWRGASRAEVASVLGEHEAAYRAAAVGAARAGAQAPGGAPAAAPSQASAVPHVAVTIPYFGCRAHVRECVESVLAQTHRNLTAIVVCDGDPVPPWDLLADIDDPRLVRFELPRNRGRYFADQVVLSAVSSPYLLVHDADDWSEPSRIETLLRRLRAEHAIGAISAAHRTRDGTGRRLLIDVQRLSRPPGAELEHLANFHGLFRTDALRAVGGFYAGFRVGYDTFLVNALAMTGRLAPVAEPLYTWRARSGSLTASPTTGMGSELRRRTAAELRDMYQAAHREYAAYLAGTLEAQAVAERIRALGVAKVPAAERRELDEQARRLAAALEHATPPKRAAAPAPARRARRARAVRAVRRPVARRVADVHELLAQPGLDWNAWTVSRTLAVELAARLERRRPRRILELGSGLSTAVLAQYALRSSAEVVTLEHEPAYALRTRRLLAGLGLEAGADVRVARLRPRRCADGKRRPWYDGDPGEGIEFVLLDGPPVTHGRGAALFALPSRLAPDWELWLDDARRDHEQECLALWREHVPFSQVLLDVDDKGLAMLAPPGSSALRDEAPVPGVGVGVLAGGRPDLLRITLDSLAARAGRALERAHVLVLLNGHDPESEACVRSAGFVDRVLVEPRRLPVGRATSTLMAELSRTQGVELILHLEDDWATCTVADGWLERAAGLLRAEARIGQVRLRHRSDGVLRRHMVTGRPLLWEPDGDALRSSSAHFTFNPSLIRAKDVRRIFPCADEHAAQRAFLRTGLTTAQLSPGVFRHAGEQRSLRVPSGRPRPPGGRSPSQPARHRPGLGRAARS